MNPDTVLFEKETVINVEFPYTVKKDIVEKLIKNNNQSNIPFGLYM